ncbi:HAD like protein [Babesia gibsoni]|uniref:HAD like protein n=1 Tax=Babesia gibsoni TaxID=33632 RepID=A0AAD8LPD2_BABGI|nr:HAD like protein [Babesia gibsoni]
MNAIMKASLPVQPPKHFAVDIDGTFLSFDDANFSKNKKAFEQALKAGYNVFFCTGRPYMSSVSILDDEFVKSTGYKGYPGVYHNGGVVYDGKGNLLRLSCFDSDFLSRLCDCLTTQHLEKYVVFCDMLDTYMLCEDSSLVKPLLEDIDVFSLPTVVDRASLLRMKISLLIVYERSILTEQTNLNSEEYVLKEGALGSWDVTPYGVNKAQGLQVLLDSYGCSEESCAFIGNGTNDIEAMDLSDVSFAVDNASEHVKSHATYTLPENSDQGAFYKAIEMVYGIKSD